MMTREKRVRKYIKDKFKYVGGDVVYAVWYFCYRVEKWEPMKIFLDSKDAKEFVEKMSKTLDKDWKITQNYIGSNSYTEFIQIIGDDVKGEKND